jgi:hypothetical protein
LVPCETFLPSRFFRPPSSKLVKLTIGVQLPHVHHLLGPERPDLVEVGSDLPKLLVSELARHALHAVVLVHLCNLEHAVLEDLVHDGDDLLGVVAELEVELLGRGIGSKVVGVEVEVGLTSETE